MVICMFGIPIQIEVMNEGINWLNNLFTIFSVFIGAVLAYYFTRKNAKKEARSKIQMELTYKLGEELIKFHDEISLYKNWISKKGSDCTYNDKLAMNIDIVNNEITDRSNRFCSMIDSIEMINMFAGYEIEILILNLRNSYNDIIEKDRNTYKELHYHILHYGTTFESTLFLQEQMVKLNYVGDMVKSLEDFTKEINNRFEEA